MTNRIFIFFGILATVMRMGEADANNPDPDSLLAKVTYITTLPLKLDMNRVSNVRVELNFNKDLISLKKADNFTVTFKSKTFSPQFSILELDRNNSRISVSRKQLEGLKFTLSSSLRLAPAYIGHATVSPESLEFSSPSTGRTIIPIKDDPSMQLQVIVVKSSGGDIWNVIFIVSVTILVTISYINLGAQLDLKNLKEIIKKPQTLVLGFLITVLVMPVVSWLVGMWLLRDQLLYRVGSFIFACCPTASASTLWTVMFNSDKELSIGLQAVSTIGSLVTMPLLLYFMDGALQLEGTKNFIQVPYGRLIQTQIVLVVALFVGWYFIGRHEKAQKISSRIFKPLTFFMLFFIIVFSSIIYWYIYAMFDLKISLTSLVITLATYGLSSVLGFVTCFNLDRAIAISISSTYKNSGIAFAVLLVAFEDPDTYINFVPCLMQVLTTSIILYLIYLVFGFVKYIRRRNQPDPIQATTPVVEDTTQVKQRSSRSGSGSSGRSKKEEEEEEEEEESDEFIAMNVTDIVAGSPKVQRTTEDSKDNTA